LEIAAQHRQIAQLVHPSHPDTPVNAERFFGSIGLRDNNIRKSGTLESLENLAKRGHLNLGSFNVGTVQALFNFATARSESKYGLPEGSPYLFGTLAGALT